MNAPAPKGPTLDAEGHLVELQDWDDVLASELTKTQGIQLNDDRWFVIRLMRAYYLEHRIYADARHAIKHLDQRYPGEGRKQLFELFPYGYVAQACRSAGMRRRRAWSTG